MKLWEINGSKFEEINSRVAILPVGAIERHGNHLPLGTDTIVPLSIAEEVAKRRNDVAVLPPIWYGSCRGLREFKGTFDIDSDVLYLYVKSVLEEAVRNGFKVILVLNGHGGNTSIVRLAAREVASKMDVHIAVIDWWRDIAIEARKELFKEPGHAGEDETSMVLCIAPNLVEMDRAFDNPVEYPKVRVYSKKVEKMLYPRALSGSATRASKENGCKWLSAIVDELLKIIEEVEKLASP